MKFLVAVSLIVFLTSGAQCCFKEEFELCKQEAGATSEELQALKSGAFGDDASDHIKCLTKCVFDALGFLKDGDLDEDIIKDRLGDQIGKENLQKILDSCKGQVGKTECDTSFKTFSCVIQFREFFLA